VVAVVACKWLQCTHNDARLAHSSAPPAGGCGRVFALASWMSPGHVRFGGECPAGQKCDERT
jgi:hypothetical protein